MQTQLKQKLFDPVLEKDSRVNTVFPSKRQHIPRKNCRCIRPKLDFVRSWLPLARLTLGRFRLQLFLGVLLCATLTSKHKSKLNRN